MICRGCFDDRGGLVLRHNTTLQMALGGLLGRTGSHDRHFYLGRIGYFGRDISVVHADLFCSLRYSLAFHAQRLQFPNDLTRAQCYTREHGAVDAALGLS
jgi:hypothetical protein